MSGPRAAAWRQGNGKSMRWAILRRVVPGGEPRRSRLTRRPQAASVLDQPPDLDRAEPGDRMTLRDLDRILPGGAIDEVEPRDDLVSLGERAVRHAHLAAALADGDRTAGAGQRPAVTAL